MAASKGRFDLIPVISEAVATSILDEMEQFNKLSPQAQGESLAEDMNDLRERNLELANAIEGVINGTIQVGYVSDRVTHSEWLNLQLALTRAFTIVIRALNEARREEQG